MKSYSEKLKSPIWQKKRLEIMNRDNWTCLCCGNQDACLNVHHLKYNGDPWEIENHFLITVCEWCHDTIENTGSNYNNDIVQRLSELLKLK